MLRRKKGVYVDIYMYSPLSFSHIYVHMCAYRQLLCCGARIIRVWEGIELRGTAASQLGWRPKERGNSTWDYGLWSGKLYLGLGLWIIGGQRKGETLPRKRKGKLHLGLRGKLEELGTDEPEGFQPFRTTWKQNVSHT